MEGKTALHLPLVVLTVRVLVPNASAVTVCCARVLPVVLVNAEKPLTVADNEVAPVSSVDQF